MSLNPSIQKERDSEQWTRWTSNHPRTSVNVDETVCLSNLALAVAILAWPILICNGIILPPVSCFLVRTTYPTTFKVPKKRIIFLFKWLWMQTFSMKSSMECWLSMYGIIYIELWHPRTFVLPWPCESHLNIRLPQGSLGLFPQSCVAPFVHAPLSQPLSTWQ